MDNSSIDKDELESILKQKPNRKILGLFRFHLWVYYLPDRNKLEEKKIEKEAKLAERNIVRKSKGKKEKAYKRTWRETLTETVGEPPVIYDETLSKKSAEQLKQYLFNKGYFNNSTAYKTVLDSNSKKANVVYTIQAKTPYTIRKIGFSIADTSLLNAIKICARKTLIRPGANYDAELIEKERERISYEMKTLGYFKFNQEYVVFKVDSNLAVHKVDIQQVVKNPSQKDAQTDSLIVSKHQKYNIDNIYINYKHDPKELLTHLNDTIIYRDFHLINLSKSFYKKGISDEVIHLKKGELYNIKNAEYTINRISSLRNFKFIDVYFEEKSSSELDCFINLTPATRQSYTIEMEGTHRSGNLGISGNVVYKNRNLFGKAEIFELKFKGGLESQQLASTEIDENSSITSGDNFPFNTLEYGPESSLNIPRLLLPINKSKLPNYFAPYTSIKSYYNYQKRPDYTRNVINLTYGYSWKTRERNHHYFDLAELSVVSIDKSASFEQRLRETNNSFLINSYTNHIISASKYAFVYSNQEMNKAKNFFYLNASIEASGNILRFIQERTSASLDENGSYTIAGIRYAQYVKPEAELRVYNVLTKWSNMVYRVFAGVGLPQKNLSVLPFEKSYFGGGTNGIRAWRARTLGPGGISDTLGLNIEKIGDIQLEGNAEYRFNVYKDLKGALFADAGNIWLLNKDSKRENGEFRWNEFYKQIAIGVGVGLRMDLNFFVIRLDAAVPIKDPALFSEERWIFQPKTQTNFYRTETGESKYKYTPVLSFGIGYPF